MRWIVKASLGVLAVMFLAGCGGDGDGDDYSDDIRAAFLEPCIAGLGEGEAAVCECAYDRIADEIPFDRFEEVDRALQDDPDAELPDEMADIVAACAADPTGGGDEETTTTPLP
jgi:hypothetical protein